MRTRIVACLLALFATPGPGLAAIAEARVSGGRVAGEIREGIAAFKGIPFAAPPLGQLRWRMPEAVVPWRGVRSARDFAPPCTQPSWGDFDHARSSEDCLYLNVWTGAASRRERRPVIVWIHGGALTGGFTSEPGSDGTILARDGVVLVSIAYRLGPFGFLAHPELTKEHGAASGNQGLHDMLAALRWVRANIAQFGGDPARVTLMGGSAGAFALSLLTTAPQARGLYARAVALGGTAIFPASSDDPAHDWFSPGLAFAENEGRKLFGKAGAPSLAAARALEPATVLQAARDLRIGTIRDGRLIVGDSRQRYAAGEFHDVPLIVGYTSDEAGEPPASVTAASARADLENAPCKHTHAAFEAAYPDFSTDEEARAVVRRVNRDSGLGWSTWTWARLQARHGKQPVFAYFFDVHGTGQPHGAPHASEYGYVFGNLPDGASERDRQISRILRGHLLNFAQRGDPNGRGLPAWPRVDESARVMVFGAWTGAQAWPSLAGIQAFDAFYECALRAP